MGLHFIYAKGSMQDYLAEDKGLGKFQIHVSITCHTGLPFFMNPQKKMFSPANLFRIPQSISKASN